MTSMFAVGTVCWVVNIILVSLYAYETRKIVTKRGVVLKGLSSFGVVAYAVVLMIMWGSISDAGKVFLLGILLTSVGDVLIGILQLTRGDPSGFLRDTLASERNATRFKVGVAGVLFICGFFFQMVAFLKGLSKIAEPNDYVISFLLFFFLAPAVSVVGALLTKFRIPSLSTNAFIVGLFYGILATALYASAACFSFALSRSDLNHGIFILVGATFFYISIAFTLASYMYPKYSENMTMRFTRRAVSFIGRMTLAGCAFLF
ncbi:MAG: hypothetical protein UHM52_04235 [Acutalibacteraceae bacterium]|nr:hypothetical protein [Acutalibacteraceae bacterium]MEE3312133.1 hypothetical protein [Acutalibacteraceae bacterium]